VIKAAAPVLGRRVAAVGALVAATAIWGSTFVVTKASLAGMGPASFMSWRFGIAAAVLVLGRPSRTWLLTSSDRGRALLLGVLLGAGFLLQTSGLQSTSAGVSGFLTGTAVILTPVMAAVFFGQQVGRAGWVAVGLSAVGVALLGYDGVTAVSSGAWLTLGGAVCFAGHITGLSQWASPGNAYGLTAWSVAVATLVSAGAAVVGDGQLALPPTVAAWRSLVYLALAATCLGFVVQAWAQSVLTAATAAVVMTVEPVFAAVLAALGGETLQRAAWLGGVLIVASMFTAELGPRKCRDALAPRVECC